MTAKELLAEGKAVLGIEFGSTRIKAVVVDEKNNAIATGTYDWENSFIDNIWTYSLEEIYAGLKGTYASLKKNIKEEYGITVKKFAAIGISGMMHGYMPFDESGKLLVPFRTWRNTITAESAKKLSELFQFNVPQRWSIAHLHNAVLKGEEHVKDVTFFTTLAGFIHWRLTGEKVLGVGEASGMFPIDDNTRKFDNEMIEKFNNLTEVSKFSWKLQDILPTVLSAGEDAGVLTKEGALLLDEEGDLEAGIPMCPPEGDAGTGMVATNSVGVRTGNVSAGTSVFAMIVLEKMLSKMYEEIDLVTTPAGDAVAMVHCNNCTSDINAWASLFKDFADTMGIKLSMGDIFTALFKKSLEADKDTGKILSYNYFSGEHITGFESGRPLLVREPDSNFNLANFMRVQLFTCFGALRTGLDILKKENVAIDKILGHGGFFKTEGVGQDVLSAVMGTPVSVMGTAGEGGAWGIAVLASYMINKNGKTLSEYLDEDVFATQEMITSTASDELKQSFNEFMIRYKKGLSVERAAVEM